MARLQMRNAGNAGRGSLSAASHYMPLTLFMIVVSVIVAALTQVGDKTEKVDFLYFASKTAVHEEYDQRYEEYVQNFRSIRAAGEKGAQPTAQQLQELDRSIKRLMEAETSLKNPDPLRDIKKGQVWRLVTPMFLHFGVLHIAFNMMWLWQFGTLLEIRFRTLRFAALVLFVAAVSCVAEAFWSGVNFGGMSGVNYGLFGFILLRSKLHPSPEFSMDKRTVMLLLVWLVVCFTGLVGNVANAAHVMGFVSGAVAGAVNAMMAGGLKVLKRRQEFRSAMSSSASTLHRCVVCGKTERSNPSLEFYVSAEDHQEYCQEHLPK